MDPEMRISRAAALCAAVLSLSSACGGESSPAAPEGLSIPDGFPAPSIPENNPFSTQKAALGRFLFYDTRLSGNQTFSCGSCHKQSLGFGDGLTVAVGSTGEFHVRNSSVLVNSAYAATLTWANPLLKSIEDQMLVPLFGHDPIEMGATGKTEEILDRLRADARYPQMFEAAFPGEAAPLSWDNIIKAIASFIRTMISGNSAFDRYVYKGESNALTDSQKRGMDLFFSERLECHHCHGGFNFTESTVHENTAFDATRFNNTGLYNLDGEGAYPTQNRGLYEVTAQPEDMGRFRAPTLRNIEVSGPYMHDGSMTTLEEIVETYAAGGRNITEGKYKGDGRKNPYKSGFVRGFTLSEQDKADLVAFLKSLTDHEFLTNPALSDPFAEEEE